ETDEPGDRGRPAPVERQLRFECVRETAHRTPGQNVDAPRVRKCWTRFREPRKGLPAGIRSRHDACVRGPQPISEEKPGHGVAWRATGLERPVFLDETGRRGRLVRLAGGVAALLVAAWLGLVVAGPFGFAKLPAAAFPALGRHLHAVNLVHR